MRLDELQIGLKGRADTTVTPANTAMAAGSGTLQVFGTPFMLALMEKAASESVQPYLPEGQSTVGTLLQVTHDAASPVGIAVWAESELLEQQGKKLIFSVTAYDAVGKIGSGLHERFIIANERFLQKAGKRLNAE